MAETTIIFPHQLYRLHPALGRDRIVIMVEEWLYFRQYAFHKQKLLLHRASMQFYRDYLSTSGYDVKYIETTDPLSDIRKLIPFLQENGTSVVHYVNTTDNWLEKRMEAGCRTAGCALERYESPNFLNTEQEVKEYLDTKTSYFQTSFYIQQRRHRKILLEAGQQPLGGRWSFDADNRLKIPKGEMLPPVKMPAENKYIAEARKYVEKKFPSNPGSSLPPFSKNASGYYPVTFNEADQWLDEFIEHRFLKFGVYQDAMLQHESILYHSLLTPMLNTGLLEPGQVIKKAEDAVTSAMVPLNAAEGFIRQVMGWREFVRILYEAEGVKQRNTNYWGFERKIPYAFWEGTTGIVPVDAVIKRVLMSGYAHHIERLMVLGNFFLLCEFSPDEVYRWFMEMFIDAYDWVMVPNVYGMSQFADGGLMATKPYISSSNYLFKMGDWKKLKPVAGILPWHETWDALFWRFMHVHRELLSKNPRLAMLLKTFDKMPEEKREGYIQVANKFLDKLG
ncbi:MAG: cryptochrome/photolyase family protein [Chitinophagaceae bacterium]